MKERLKQRLRALVFPLATVVIAFVIGGLVVILVGANPFTVYKQLAVGAGLDWPFQYLPGHPVHVDPVVSEINLTHTLTYATPLVLTGLAVGFAFRCGLFNIGGQGQYWVGAYLAIEVALYVTDHWPGHGREAVFLATVAAALMGSAWAAIAGFLKAYRGAHEVISTIMLNWIAIFGGQWLFGLGRPVAGQDLERAGVAHAAAVGDVQLDLGVHPRLERDGRALHRARRGRRLLR